MEDTYFEEHVFESVDFSEKGPAKGEYANCSFIHCNLSGADLSRSKLIGCEFKNCNLSMIKIARTVLNDARFRECKMLGVNFENCHDFLFLVDFEDCILNFSIFYKRSLKKIRFKNCSLLEVDFTEADLSGSVFDNCDMTGAKFEHTILEKADFRSSRNYSIDPGKNRIKKAKFSMAGIPGLLDKHDIEIH